MFDDRAKVLLRAMVVLFLAGCGPAGVLRSGTDVPATSASSRLGVPVLRAQTAALAVPAPRLVRRMTGASKATAKLELDLFPDTKVSIEEIEVRASGRRQILAGRPALDPNGWAYLGVEGELVSGFIRAGNRDYVLLADGPGRVLVNEVDVGVYPRELPPKPAANARPRPAAPALLRSHTAPELDVLVLYTPAVQTQLGASLQMQVGAAITSANDAYANSGIEQRIRLAALEPVAYTESGKLGTDLDRLQATNDGSIDGIHLLRDRHAADVVVLLVASGDGCGKANLAWISSDADDDSAFAVVVQPCLSNQSLTHELGHIAGAHHDSWVDPTPIPRYAHGFVSLFIEQTPESDAPNSGQRICRPSPNGEWRTIMSYSDKCDSCNVTCPRINYFSNPSVVHADGRAMGSGSANNARRLNETAITLEGFRVRGPRVSLYEGNQGTQDHVCVVSTLADESIELGGPLDFRFCDNDEARSLRLFDVPAGRVLRLYDDPGGRTQDDWVEITVKRDVVDKLIGTFERSFEDDDVRVVFHRNDGLDGKVSRLQVSRVASGATIDLHEGNNGSQNLVCVIPIGQTNTIRFPGHADCDNDEARSVTLTAVPAGTVIRLFDDPDGSRSDDWVEITVLRDVARRTVGTFERSVTDADVRVSYHRHNGLDGKVSRLEVGAQSSGPRIELHEGNRGTQDRVCAIAASPALALDFTRGGDCDNDEARSLTLHDVPAGMLLLLFDSPGGNKEDDWVAIETKRAVARRTIDSFESTFEDGDLRVVYLRNNGLDGKVSRLEVTQAGALQGVTSWYEGNDGRQNKVCDLAAVGQTIRFKSHQACDNDEARSLVLTQVPPNVRIEVFDNPDCRANDDYTIIEVKRAVFRKVIGTFQRSFEDDDVRVEYHRDNGLDGKVSCVKIVR